MNTMAAPGTTGLCQILPAPFWSFLGILNYGAFANWASGAAMRRKITRQSVKVGGTYVARAIGQCRTKPPEWWGKA